MATRESRSNNGSTRSVSDGTSVPDPARRAEKVSEVVARAIAQDVANRDLPTGTMLPSEAAMLERYRVGRASLREGLRILEIQGLITIKPGPGGGPVVAAANSQDFGRMSTLHYQGVRATFRELIDARMTIETLMARLAAEQRDPELLAELRAVSDATNQGLDEARTYLAGSKGFHTVIAGSSDNRVLNLFARSLQDVYSARVSGFLFPPEARERVSKDHDAIIRAIERGDGKRTERLMRDHMEEFAQLCAARYPGMLDEVVDWR